MDRRLTFWITLSLCLSNTGILCIATIVECTPTDTDGFFSSHKADGIIYSLSENNQLSEKNAAIFCSIEGENNHFVKFEIVIYGEPPKSVMLELENNIFSKMNYSTIFCSMSDVNDINRVIRTEEEKFFTGLLDNFEYKCGRTSEMKIVLQGLKTLSHDLKGLVQSIGMTDSVECVADMDRNGKTHPNLGKYCGEGRYMYNKTGDFVCTKCCTDYHWSRLDAQCEKCGDCSTRKDPNIWSDCNPTQCKTSTTPKGSSTKRSTVTSIAPETEQLPTTTASTKLTTTPNTPPITKPDASPEKLKLVARRNTSVVMEWSAIPGVSYEVEIRDVNGGYPRYLPSNTSHLNISGLIQGNSYQTAVRAKNSAGPGPWSPSVSVRTLGTEPKRSPKNVKVVLKEDTLVVSWDGTNKTTDGAEEPLKGYKATVLLNNNMDRVRFAELGQTSLDILLTKYGSYTILVYYYNDIGDGPAVKTPVEYQAEKSKNINGTAVFFGFFFIIFAIFAISCMPVFRKLETCYDDRYNYQAAPQGPANLPPENGDQDAPI